ncbi:MAG: hypothetical protein ABIN56_04255 [Dokdonella sp.]
MEALGLTALGPASAPEIIPDTEIPAGSDRELVSRLGIVRRNFTIARSATSMVRIEAVEITWSQLTQWIKNEYLGYDLSSVADFKPVDGCPRVPAWDEKSSQSSPQPRVTLNKTLKEKVLDRSLVDAALYAGTYGLKIERGFGEALCRATWPAGSINARGAGRGNRCIWPKIGEVPDQGYVFVTHSLGSRLTYDTLLALATPTKRDGVKVFEDDADRGCFVNHLMARTPIIYMMANQLPFLGLANAPANASPGDSQVPFIALPRVVHPADLADASSKPSADASPALGQEIKAFASLRSDGECGHAKGALSVVAFSDPNDLLSFGIPSWYVADGGERSVAVKVTNVYVNNSPRILGLYESVPAAHADYFSNPDVWKVMKCGAVGGVVRSCL